MRTITQVPQNPDQDIPLLFYLVDFSLQRLSSPVIARLVEDALAVAPDARVAGLGPAALRQSGRPRPPILGQSHGNTYF